ncbi:MAG: hypothetical protein ACJ8BF_05510, partial [Gemmatimonadales bacterium]
MWVAFRTAAVSDLTLFRNRDLVLVAQLPYEPIVHAMRFRPALNVPEEFAMKFPVLRPILG